MIYSTQEENYSETYLKAISEFIELTLELYDLGPVNIRRKSDKRPRFSF
jgi:hypothetical protein